MNRIDKFLVILIMGGVITACTASSYIPQIGGTIPQEETAEEFSRRQQEAIYSSNGFKITMVGTGITVISLLCFCIRSCIQECSLETSKNNKELRSILKVKRSSVVPQRAIEIVVDDKMAQSDPKEEDTRPQIRTTPVNEMLAAPSSSPPIQLVAHPENVQRVNFMELQPVNFSGPVVQKIKFKYPPPYDMVNRH